MAPNQQFVSLILLCLLHAAIAALGVEPATASAAAAAATTAAGGGRVKREAAGVKRELEGGDDDDYVPRSATAANRIDLTEEVRGWGACMLVGRPNVSA